MKRVLCFAFILVLGFSAFAGTLSGDVIEEYYEQGYEYGDYSPFWLDFLGVVGVNSWDAGYYVDEFGDKTDDAYFYYIGKGSYTTESSVDSSTFYYIITDDSEGISFYLLSSFGSNLASNSIKGTFTVTYKGDSSTVKASGTFSKKKAVLTDTSASDSFRKVLESGKNIKVIITQDGTVSESKKYNLGTIGNSTYKTAWDKAYCYTIKYDTNGGKGSIATDKVMKGEKATVNAGSSISRNTFEFIGWNTALDGKGKSYKAGEEIIPKGNLTLYAQWTLPKGPAGGYIFYDVDADNDTGNADGFISTECGWRFLEAAPSDLDGTYIFGYYSPNNDYYVVDVGTETGIGTGKSNTEALINAMTDKAYGYDWKSVENYAAKACDTYSIEVDGITYDDWFLPSKDELDFMYKNLYKNGLGDFKNKEYWSSSEGNSGRAWSQGFYYGVQYSSDRYHDYYVRPIRAF